jgi:GTP-binding protein
MDSGDLEKEKGITILAKNTAVHRKHADGTTTVINVIDTPGHADFGGEVERGLSMVDGVLLLVDASEGPLPQTRFVLRKALAAHLPVILVVNKTDRPDARISEVVSESHDLLLDVASDLDDEAQKAAEHALGLPTLYASGRAGIASTTEPANGENPEGDNLDPLFDVLLEHIPPPQGDPTAPLQALVTNLDASPFLGRLALIRIYKGRIRKGQQVAWMREVDGHPVITNAKITELLVTEGVERTPTDEAIAGDIVAVAGIPEIMIGDTLADPDHAHALPRITVDEPAISVTIGTNTSPLAGKVKGHKLTARMVKSRLDAELVGNVSIKVVDIDRPDAWEVQGRGELALAVLVEQMRREGFELTVGKPQVVTQTIDGKLHEPFEAMTIDCPDEFVGAITQLMAARKGRMEEMTNHAAGWVRMDFIVPSRGLIGFRTDFLTLTRGTGIANAVFDGYRPWAGEIRARHTGSLVSDRAGRRMRRSDPGDRAGAQSRAGRHLPGPEPVARQGPGLRTGGRTGCCAAARYPEQRAETSPPFVDGARRLDLAGRTRSVGLHRQPAAGAAEHRYAAQLGAAAAPGQRDHHGHRLDRGRLQSASAVRSVPRERGDQRAGAAERVSAGPRHQHADRLTLGDGPYPIGVGRGDQSEPVHGHLQDPARGAVDRQRAHCRRRLLVPVAPDGQPAWGRRPGRL